MHDGGVNRIALLLLLAVCGGCRIAHAAATSIQSVPDPRTSGGWVSDVANILGSDQVQNFNQLFTELETETGAEVAMVTVQDVEGTPKEFATALFNHWRLGKAGANNGLLVLMVLGQRRLEMETGYGLEEILPDGWLGEMQARAMVPSFKRGAYGEGLAVGMMEVAARLRGNAAAVREGASAPFAEAPPMDDSSFPLWPLFGFGAPSAAFGLWRWRRKQRRTCPKCRILMPALDEQADDAFLVAGQRAEEQVGSVDHEVRKCGTCGFMRILSRRKFFSAYSKCGACDFTTLLTESTTLTRATTYSTGLKHVSESCKHCGYANSYTSVIPMIVESSSSGSSSGSSSFGGSNSSRSSSGSSGGGYSGGGGAGSSW